MFKHASLSLVGLLSGVILTVVIGPVFGMPPVGTIRLTVPTPPLPPVSFPACIKDRVVAIFNAWSGAGQTTQGDQALDMNANRLLNGWEQGSLVCKTGCTGTRTEAGTWIRAATYEVTPDTICAYKLEIFGDFMGEVQWHRYQLPPAQGGACPLQDQEASAVATLIVNFSDNGYTRKQHLRNQSIEADDCVCPGVAPTGLCAGTYTDLDQCLNSKELKITRTIAKGGAPFTFQVLSIGGENQDGTGTNKSQVDEETKAYVHLQGCAITRMMSDNIMIKITALP